MHYAIINHILFSLFNGGACNSQLTDPQFTDQLLGTSESLENATIKKNIKVEQDETKDLRQKQTQKSMISTGVRSCVSGVGDGAQETRVGALPCTLP